MLSTEYSVLEPRQFAQVRGHDGLRAAPDQKEQRFAAPAASRVTLQVAGSFGGCQGRLRGAEGQAVGSGSQLFAAADFITRGQRQQVMLKLTMFGVQAFGSGGQVFAAIGFCCDERDRSAGQTNRQRGSLQAARFRAGGTL